MNFVVKYQVRVGETVHHRELHTAAQSKFSQKQLHGKSSGEMQEMLWSEHGINWNDYDPRFKRGTAITQEIRVGAVTYVDKRTNEERTTNSVERKIWVSGPAPIFTKEPVSL